MREIRVHAIHNRTAEDLHIPVAGRPTIDVPAGQTVEGLWVVRYDEAEHPEMARIASPNEAWFIDSPDVITWASVTFPTPPD